MEPLSTLREAIAKVPRVAFALGVLGIGVAASSLVKLSGDGRVAIISVTAMFTGMILLYIFSRIEQSSDTIVKLCGQTLVIVTTIVFVSLIATIFLAAISCHPRSLANFLRIQDICDASSASQEKSAFKQDPGGFGATIPAQISPISGQHFDDFPRYVTLNWHALPGAVKYMIEIQIQTPPDLEWRSAVTSPLDPWSQIIITTTSFGYSPPGENTYRWRVVGINENNRSSTPSPWQVFYSDK